MKFKLRNIKCVFSVQESLDWMLKEFKFHKRNYTLRLENRICLTLYPKNLFKIHATGISNSDDLNCVLSFFESKCIKVCNATVNNSFWILKPLIIQSFDKFAKFCQEKNKQKKNSSITIDLSNIGLNADGCFLNAIYLRQLGCHGVVIIHRKCSLILGPTNISELKQLRKGFQTLLNQYESNKDIVE